MQKTNSSYKQILKSTGIFGGSQIITILIGIARNKLIAILLGASGVGLISIYQSVMDMIKSIAGFGVETSGVREIAQHLEKEDQIETYKSIATIDSWSIILASFGALIALLSAYPLSFWLFEDSSHAMQIGALSICLFFSIMAAGQAVILQGLRQIAYMVKSAIIWNIAGLIISIPLYYYFRLDGIIPVFIIVSIAMYLSALIYRRKLDIPPIKLSYSEIKERGISLLRLGFFIAAAAIPTTAGFFIIRAFLNNNDGLASVGLFQAAWTITNVYLAIVLKSMGSDFYPRLCSIIENNTNTRKLINEQTYVVLAVSTPIIISLLLFSKIALVLLYSSEFSGASSVLNWQIFGTFFKVLSWPLGFILLAKSKGLLFFITEMLYLIVYIGSMYLLYPYFGFESVGIAYFIGYLAYLPIMIIIGRNLSEFSWTKENLVSALICFILILLSFILARYNEVFVILPLILSGVFSLIKINRIFPLKSLPSFLKKNNKE